MFKILILEVISLKRIALLSWAFCCLHGCETGLCSVGSTLVCFLSGDRWRCSAPAEKWDDDEISGAEAGACTETQLPHWQTQTAPAVILGFPLSLPPCFCWVRLTGQASGFLHFWCITGTKGSHHTSVCHLSRSQRSTSAHRSTKNRPGAQKHSSDSL